MFHTITVHAIIDCFKVQSDHSVITFSLAVSLSSHKKQSTSIFNYWKGDWDNLNFFL